MRRSRSPSAPPARAAPVSGDGTRGNGSSGGLMPVCTAPARARARTPKVSGFVGGSTPFRSRGACRRLCDSGRTQKCCRGDIPRHHHPYCPRALQRQPSKQTPPPRSKLKSCQPRGGRGLPRSGHRAAEPSSQGTPLNRTLPLRGLANSDPQLQSPCCTTSAFKSEKTKQNSSRCRQNSWCAQTKAKQMDSASALAAQRREGRRREMPVWGRYV